MGHTKKCHFQKSTYAYNFFVSASFATIFGSFESARDALSNDHKIVAKDAETKKLEAYVGFGK